MWLKVWQDSIVLVCSQDSYTKKLLCHPYFHLEFDQFCYAEIRLFPFVGTRNIIIALYLSTSKYHKRLCGSFSHHLCQFLYMSCASCRHTRSSLIHFACIGVASPRLFVLQGKQLQCSQNGSNLIYRHTVNALHSSSPW